MLEQQRQHEQQQLQQQGRQPGRLVGGSVSLQELTVVAELARRAAGGSQPITQQHVLLALQHLHASRQGGVGRWVG